MAHTIGVPRETEAHETRVALVPDVVVRLVKGGFAVAVERGAGDRASHADAEYEAAGASLTDRTGAFSADVVVKVQPPDDAEVAMLKSGQVLIGFMRPLDQPEVARALAAQGVTTLAMELVPRISRAQRMDALSAMSAVGGYKAVLKAADALPKFFPLLTTAAGTIRPAKVLVLGAGVAGLQAIATARRLGAIASAYDVRPAVKEEVESLGGKFVELELETAEAAADSGYAKALAEDKQKRQIELLTPHIADADVVISTALIPGRKAPVLITEAALEQMRDGSVVVDLAAPNGGNCEQTVPGETTRKHGVTLIGPLNLPAEMAVHASQMYARTVMAMLQEFSDHGTFTAAPDDAVFAGSCLTHGGEVTNERVRGVLAGSA